MVSFEQPEDESRDSSVAGLLADSDDRNLSNAGLNNL